MQSACEGDVTRAPRRFRARRRLVPLTPVRAPGQRTARFSLEVSLPSRDATVNPSLTRGRRWSRVRVDSDTARRYTDPGEVAERTKALDSKSSIPLIPGSWVRIPPSPPFPLRPYRAGLQHSRTRLSLFAASRERSGRRPCRLRSRSPAPFGIHCCLRHSTPPQPSADCALRACPGLRW